MTKFLIFNRQKFAEFLFYILCIFLIILMSGCNENHTYPNEIPTAAISSPVDGSAYDEGNLIVFVGSGTDPEDISLRGTSLVWYSSIDGQIGTGSSFTVDTLTTGTHTITLAVFDSDGASGSALVSITVNP